MHLRNEKRYSPDDGPYIPRKRRQLSTKEDLDRARLITTQNEQSPLFTRLPRELRDMIWEHAFGSDETTFQYRNLAIIASNQDYDYCDRHLQGLPDWLLLCKTILGEALEVFYSTQTYAPATDYLRSRPRPMPIMGGKRRQLGGKSCCRRTPRNPIDRSEYKNTLVFNKNVKNVGIPLATDLVWPGAIGAPQSNFYFSPNAVHSMFLRYLQRFRVDLKDVRLTCDLTFLCPSCFNENTIEDMGTRKGKGKKRLNGTLEGLRGCCRNLIFRVETDACGHCELDCSKPLVEADAPVEAWAKSIVGMDAEVHVREEWRYESQYVRKPMFRTIRVCRQKS